MQEKLTKELFEYIEAGDVHGVEVKLNELKKNTSFDINSRYLNNQTPLVYAVFCNKIDVVRFLLEKSGADANARNAKGNMLLHVVCSNLGIVRILIENKADVNARNANDDTPLHLCVRPEIARFLIENNAVVNARNAKGNTPLHLSTNPEITRILIGSGANLEAENNDGVTPLAFISKNTYHAREEMKEMLKAGANPNVSVQGKSFLANLIYGYINLPFPNMKVDLVKLMGFAFYHGVRYTEADGKVFESVTTSIGKNLKVFLDRINIAVTLLAPRLLKRVGEKSEFEKNIPEALVRRLLNTLPKHTFAHHEAFMDGYKEAQQEQAATKIQKNFRAYLSRKSAPAVIGT